MILYLFADL